MSNDLDQYVRTAANLVKSMDYDELISEMKSHGIKGKPRTAESCPLANYLNHLTSDSGIEWYVGSSGFGVENEPYRTNLGSPHFNQSDAMNKFRTAFDAMSNFIAPSER